MTQLILTILTYTIKVPLHMIRKLFYEIRKQVLGGRVIVKRGDVVYVPLWVPIALAIALFIPTIWDDVASVISRVHDKISLGVYQITHPPGGGIAELFAPPVQHWSSKISEWSDLYDVEANLMATVMQIESCGHPTVVSSAGANGLFQVMPFHFTSSENMVDPDTNAKRGGIFLNYCLNASKGDIGLALACYNGGPSVINRPMSSWPNETQRYYRWGVGIYSDAIVNRPESNTLHQWMNAGGSVLCNMAMDEITNHSSSVGVASS